MTGQPTPHGLARAIVAEHLENLPRSLDTSFNDRERRMEFDAAIRATYAPSVTSMTLLELERLEDDFERRLPPEMRADFVKLVNGYTEQLSLAEQTGWLVGLHAGRGGAA